jgi:hypothetical protein
MATVAEKISTVSQGKLHFGRLKEVEHVRREWFMDVPAGIMLDDVLKPGYLVNFTKNLRPLDRIEAFCEDGSWEAMLRVMFVGQTEVKTRVIYRLDTSEPGDDNVAPLSETYDIIWRGPVLRFCVINTVTREIIKDHLYPRAEAMQYLRQHLHTMKA